MFNKFQKNTSGILGAIIIGLIIISFMFSGYQSMKGTPDTVAKVGSIQIKAREYQGEFNRQLQFYKQIFGGKDLTRKQIEQFKIKEATLRNLVNRALMLQFAEDVGIVTSNQEVSEEIKKLPYFKINDRFDVERYKSLLTQNRMTPADFEEQLADDLTRQKVKDVLGSFPISDSYWNDISNFRKQKYNSDIIQISKKSLQKHIKISNQTISNFLSKTENMERVRVRFDEKKSQLDRPEKVKASHILLQTTADNEQKVLEKIESISKKLTKKNFAKMANKYTEDPSGKNKGGSLGWFTMGRMVPEFDAMVFSMEPGTISPPIKTSFGYHIIYLEDKKEAQPATFKKFKNKVAADLIREDSPELVKTFATGFGKKLKTLLSKNDKKQLKELKKQYSFKFDEDKTVNRIDGSVGTIMLANDHLKAIFAEKQKSSKVFVFDDAANLTVVKISPDKKDKKDPEEKKSSLSNVLSKKLTQELLQKASEDTSIKTFNI